MLKLGDADVRCGSGRGQSPERVSAETSTAASNCSSRRGRRGGMIASILSDVYVGITARPLTELRVTVEAMRRGIPVAEPMGAMVEWISPVLYRGFFLTRAVPGMTLWEFVQTDDDPTVRRHVLGQVRSRDRHDARQGPLSRRSKSAQPARHSRARQFQRDHHRPRQVAPLRRAGVVRDAPQERRALVAISAQTRSVGKISRRSCAVIAESRLSPTSRRKG